MLQGFYIFVIFVCKRNVYNAILKKTGKYNPQSSKGVLRKKKTQSAQSGSVGNTSGTRMTRMQSEPVA